MGKGRGKGSKGGYYSSGSGGGCDCCDFDEWPWSSLCWILTVTWFIIAMVWTFSVIPHSRYSEDPILHSGEMRVLDLPEKNAYALSTFQYTDSLGMIDIYRIQSEPPLLTPTNAAAQNKSARTVIEQIRDTYGFPEQYDWWYQNSWMTPGSTVVLQASCSGPAYLNIITGDYAFYRWRIAANGENEDLDRADWVTTRRYYAGGVGTTNVLTWVQPTPSDEIYFTVMKDSTDEGVTIDCSMKVNLTLIPYDLSGVSLIYPASRQQREIDSEHGTKLLLVAPVPAAGRSWFDIGVKIRQDIRSVLAVGPMMGIMFAGIVGLTAIGCILDQISESRRACIWFAKDCLLASFYCWGCECNWVFCKCSLWDWDECECKCRNCHCPDCSCCSCDDWCNNNDVPISQSSAYITSAESYPSPAAASTVQPTPVISEAMRRDQLKQTAEIEMRMANPTPVVPADPVAVTVVPAAAPSPLSADPIVVVASATPAAPDVPVDSRNAGPSAPPAQ